MRCFLKKTIIYIFFTLCLMILHSIEYLDLNFFIEPKFEENNFNKSRFILENTITDSLVQINIFAGQILQKTKSDSSVISFLDSVNCQYASPTDYLFSEGNDDLNFEIITSNIRKDTIPIIENVILQADSFSVGIFSLYSPDFVVKNKIDAEAEFIYDVFRVAKEQAKFLEKKTDFIVMMSNVTKYIDEDIVRELPIDAVVSFDYQKSKCELLSNKITEFYSILSHRGKFGKLRFTFENGKLESEWIEKKF